MLVLESLSVGYGSQAILTGIDLTVPPGEVLALIGPNGAGKSTLIRAACGLLAPLSGKVTMEGQELSRLRPEERARRVAVVPQAVRLPEAFTVLDTVLMGRTAYLGWNGRETEADRDAARAAMERTSTSEIAGRRLGELSGGEQQLVLIARALAQSAPVLLLDEPTAHLDLRHQASILGLVRDLARSDGHRVLMAIHDLNLASAYADRVAILHGGRLQVVGPPGEAFTAANVKAAFGAEVTIFPHPRRGSPIILAERDGREATL